MAGRHAFRDGYLVATVLAAVAWAAPSALGQQPATRNPHAGEWSLEFRVATRPGGQTRVASRGFTPEDMQTMNLLLNVSRPTFTVAADGVLRWEQREGGQFHWDDFSTLAGKTATSDTQAVLRAQGKVTATPAPEGSGRTYDRRLTLNLYWSGGTGMTVDHRGLPWPVTLSADGNQVITPFGGGPAVYERSQWELEPASDQREELATDVIRETTVFRAARQTASSVYKLGIAQAPLNFIERIEVKHIHHPRLVPRG